MTELWRRLTSAILSNEKRRVLYAVQAYAERWGMGITKQTFLAELDKQRQEQLDGHDHLTDAVRLRLRSDPVKQLRRQRMKAREHDERIPFDTRVAVLVRARDRCECCFRLSKLELHHIHHHSHGTEQAEDLLALCRRCHDERHC